MEDTKLTGKLYFRFSDKLGRRESKLLAEIFNYEPVVINLEAKPEDKDGVRMSFKDGDYTFELFIEPEHTTSKSWTIEYIDYNKCLVCEENGKPGPHETSLSKPYGEGGWQRTFQCLGCGSRYLVTEGDKMGGQFDHIELIK